MEETSYTADSIRVLSDVEAVRTRPGMYVGDPNDGGLLETVLSAASDALRAAVAGRCTRVVVTLHRDGSCSVEDDGPGWPVGPCPDGVPAAQRLLTALHAAGGANAEAVCLGEPMYANFLSEWLWLDIWRDGVAYRQYYERGVPRGPLSPCG